MQRAFVRSGINMVYSQGFNPRPKLSLVLPKNVGLASEGDLFCVQITCGDDTTSHGEIFTRISRQLPGGISLEDIVVHGKKVGCRVVEAEYLIRIDNEEKLKSAVVRADELNRLIQAGEEIIIERIIDDEGSVKTVEIGKFLKSFEKVSQGIKVVCKITDRGTIRPDEILKLLNMEPSEISSSIVRNKINWQVN